MLKTSENSEIDLNSSTDSQSSVIDATGQTVIEVPHSDFISNSTLSRDGQNLSLESPQGETLVIQNYFNTNPSALLESPDGAILTKDLVNSFLKASPEYAQKNTMSDESPVGAVEEMTGDATVTRIDGTSEPLTLGSPIFKGDTIETSESGAVNIVFIDETSMAISNNARMAIDEYQFDPSTESGETNLSILRGVFVFTSGLIGRDDPDDVKIDTPVGSIGIRGTIIAGNIRPGAESEITVLEGAIVVTNNVTQTTLSQQYESVKLGGFNSSIETIGVKAAQEMSDTYGSVSDVLPKLFSSINDNIKQEAIESKAQSTEEETTEVVDDILEEAQTEAVIEETINDPIVDNIIQEPLFNTIFTETPNAENELKSINAKQRAIIKSKGIENNNIDNPNLEIFENTSPLTLTAGRNLLFEGAQIGDVVGRFLASGGTSSNKVFLFENHTTTSSDGQFTLHQIAPNIAEIRLASTATAVTTPQGSGFSVFVSDSSGAQANVTISAPIVQDAVVNLNAPGGLDYAVDIALANTSPRINIGDINGDGVNDYAITNSASDRADIFDGSTNNNIFGQNGLGGSGYGSSVANLGDINNDGYADTAIGGPNSTDGYYDLILGASSVVSGSFNGGIAIGDNYGQTLAGIGDFDGDGKSDYAVGAPGASSNAGVVSLMLSTGITPTIIGTSTQNTGSFLQGIGDINGDGLSDILIGNGIGNTEAYIVYGGTTTSLTTGGLGGDGTRIITPNILRAAGAAGDFNGDGFDDFAVSVDAGSDIDTYIVYGDGSLPTLNLSFLENPDNALKLKHSGVGGATDYKISSLGDIDGDGFDDIQIGVNGENQFIVHGELGGNAPYVTDGAVNDGALTNGVIGATVDGQSMVGDTHFMDKTGVTSYNNLSMRGGDGNNSFSLTGTSFRNIDGGDGIDTIRHSVTGGNLDFTAIDFEQISQIEQIHLTKSNSSITLTAENIFNLLKSSDDQSLTIELGSSSGTPAINGTLNIDADTPNGVSIQDQVENALNENGAGANHVGTAGGYDHYEIGGYDLYIDTDLTTAVV